MTGEIPTMEAASPYYVKFEEDNTRVKICRGKGLVLDYNWEERVINLGLVPVILFRKAFAELGKTGVCGDDAMFEVPWQAAQSLKMIIEIFNKCSKETSIQIVRDTKVLVYIYEKDWETLLDIVSVYVLAKKLEIKGLE